MPSITLSDIDSATVAAMAKHIAPKKDVRRYLVGVQLECTPRGWLAISTDGNMLTVARLSNPDGDSARHGFSIFVPRDLALTLKGTAVIGFEGETGPRSIRIAGATLDLPFDPDQYFPDWRRVVPRSCSNEPAQFNPDLVSAVQSVADAMNGKRRALGYLRHNGQAAACMTFASVDLCAVIMPMRTGDQDGIRPVWVFDDASAAAAAAVNAAIDQALSAVSESPVTVAPTAMGLHKFSASAAA